MPLTGITVNAFFCYRCLVDFDDPRCVYAGNHQRHHYKEVAENKVIQVTFRFCI